MDLIVVVRVIVMCCVRGSCSDVLLLVEVVSVHSSPSPAQPSPAQLQSVLSSAGLSPGALGHQHSSPARDGGGPTVWSTLGQVNWEIHSISFHQNIA